MTEYSEAVVRREFAEARVAAVQAAYDAQRQGCALPDAPPPSESRGRVQVTRRRLAAATLVLVVLVGIIQVAYVATH